LHSRIEENLEIGAIVGVGVECDSGGINCRQSDGMGSALFMDHGLIHWLDYVFDFDGAVRAVGEGRGEKIVILYPKRFNDMELEVKLINNLVCNCARILHIGVC